MARFSVLPSVEHFIVLKNITKKSSINYSLKNQVIPGQTNREDLKHSKTNTFERTFFLQEKYESYIRREEFGFQSKTTPSHFKHKEEFNIHNFCLCREY